MKGGESMKRKIKIAATYLISTMFMIPAAVLAQYAQPTDTGLPGGVSGASISDLIHNIMLWLLGILGFVAVIGFVISGIMYLIAAGDEDAQARAKRAMIYSITGVVVGLVGLVILFAVTQLFGGATTF
jgi:heme/copper-type cytochrome/quinol oxidase subunit 2